MSGAGAGGLAGALAALQADRRFESCRADRQAGQAHVEALLANECEDTLHAASQGRWAKATTYSYDAARKAVASLLLAHGWRARNAPGAHGAVVDFVQVWLGTQDPPGPRIARTYAAARAARHDDEYPHPQGVPRSDKELRLFAEDNIRLMNAAREALGLKVHPMLVPTRANLESRKNS